MEAKQDIAAVTEHGLKLLNMAKCEDALRSKGFAVADENLQVDPVLEDRGCIADGDSWCLEDIATTHPNGEVRALKGIIVRKDKEYQEMQKFKAGLQEKVDQLSQLLKRYERLDDARTSYNIEDYTPLNRLNREKNLLRELDDQFQHNEVVERLLISNEDLSRECSQLKKKLNETINALTGVEEQMEGLVTDKLRETENCNSLACELALAQAKVLHLEQLAHVEVGKMMSESSSSLPSGSVMQNSSLPRESIVKESCSSLLPSSVRINSSLLKESTVQETESDMPVLRPAVAKDYSSIDKVTERRLPERAQIKPTLNLQQTSKSEEFCHHLSQTLLTKQKVNFNLVNNLCGHLKSPISFSDMDDNKLCEYQLRLMEARDSGTDMDPLVLDAQIKELNLYLSGQSGWSWRNPEPVTPRPCFVKFSVHGWRTTAAKIRAHFNLRGVTAVEVVGAAAVVSFKTPEDAKAVLDMGHHVVGNCHLVPGQVVMVDEGNGSLGSEVGAMCSKATCSVVGAKATCSVVDDGDDDVIDRTVELFKTGEASEELLKSIPGVESATTDGNTVRLMYAEQKVCEEVLEEGYIMVGEEKMLVGRIGQLGWVEIEVTGGEEAMESEELLNLLERAGISPVLDILDRGRGMFGIVLENAKRKQLVKRRQLPLEGGLWANVVEGHKQFHGDLERGEELAGKMIEPAEEDVHLNLDQAGSGYKNRPSNTRRDVNDNLIDNEMEELREVVNESLGYSSSGSSNVNFHEEDCLPNPAEKNPFQVEVVKIYLTSSKNVSKKAGNSYDQ